MDSIDTAALDLSGLAAGSSAIYGGIRNLSDGLDQLSDSFALTDSAIAAQSGGAYDSLAQANQQTITALTLQVMLLQADPVGNTLQIQQLTQIIGLLTADNELIAGLKTGINGDGTTANPGLAAGSAALADQYASFDAAIQQLPSQIGELAAGITQLQYAMGQLSANYSSFDSGLASYLGGAASICNGLRSLETGFAELSAGSKELGEGASQLAAGTAKLAEGTGELNDQTASMNDDVQARLDEYLAPYMNNDFEIVSFMSPRNTTVTAVQFVLKTSGIFIESEAVEPSGPEDLTIWERFLALFNR